VNTDFGDHHHLHNSHLGYAGLEGIFPWLPLLAGTLMAIAMVWILILLLRGNPSEQSHCFWILASRRATVRRRWHGAMRTHAATAQQFAAYECAPAAVAEHPDLADVTRPATALFIDAFTGANELATERYPGAEHAERFIQAAEHSQRAWQAAVGAARHSGASRFAPHGRVRLQHTVASQRPDSTPTRSGRHRAPDRCPQHSLDRPAHLRLVPPH
jgi:hypothetical protein